MITAFLLIVYLGDRIISQNIYFRSIDDCQYFAKRLSDQPTVPSKKEDVKRMSYTAVCEIKKVKRDNITLH